MLLVLLTVRVRAAETSLLEQETQRLLEQMDIASLQELAPEVPMYDVIQSASKGESLLDPQTILQSLKSAAQGALKASLPGMLRIAGIGILSAGLARLGIGQEAGRLCELTGGLCAGIVLSSQVTELLSLGKQTIQRIADFTNAVLPSLLALLTACGAERSAAGLKRLTLAVTGGFTEFVHGVLLTLLGCAAALVLVSAMTEDRAPAAVAKALRSAVHWVLGACFAAYLGCIAVQGSAGAHYDGVALRVARYAMDKTIPVVGGVFKDVSDTLIGCALVVKNAVGTAGLVGLSAMALRPVMQVLCAVFACRMCSAVLEAFDAERFCAMLHGFADILTTLLILILSAGALNLIALSSLMYTGMGFM